MFFQVVCVLSAHDFCSRPRTAEQSPRREVDAPAPASIDFTSVSRRLTTPSDIIDDRPPEPAPDPYCSLRSDVHSGCYNTRWVSNVESAPATLVVHLTYP